VAASAAVGGAVVEAAPQGDGKMSSPAKRFLSRTEQQRVTEAVRAAEQLTSGEIVPLIASRSHDHPTAAISASVALAIPLALLLSTQIGSRLWLGADSVWLFLITALVLHGLLYPITLRSDLLKRPFLGDRRAEREVQRAAVAAFYAEGLHQTAEANGILLYISVVEERVWILADRNINHLVEQKVWDEMVDQLTRGIRSGKRCEAICTTIHRIGEILRHHFPHHKKDSDELHNLIIR
jgi:putative membrane protein